MTVSIVIPTYNRAYIIGDAIASALAQTFSETEIVVVDDGSSDGTRDIVNKINSDRIRYLPHSSNRGYSAACNSGISASKGEFVAFLDSDDIWKSDYLERQVGFFRKHPETGVVFSDTEIREEFGSVPSLIGLLRVFPRMLHASPIADEYLFSSRQMYLCLLEEVPIKPTATLVRRELFELVGIFDEAWPSGTDWDLFLRLSRVTSFGFINHPLVIQRRTSDATHQKFREKDKQFLLSIFLKEKARLHDDSEALMVVNRGIVSHSKDLAWNYLQARRRLDAMAVYFEAYKESGELSMLGKIAWSLIPLRAQAAIRACLKKSSPETISL